MSPHNCTILESWVLENFILADEPFPKPLQLFRTCVLINNLWEKLVSSLELPITFDERFEVTSVPFFIPSFNLLSCELKNFIFKGYTETFYINTILKQNKFKILSPFLVKNLKWLLSILQ